MGDVENRNPTQSERQSATGSVAVTATAIQQRYPTGRTILIFMRHF